MDLSNIYTFIVQNPSVIPHEKIQDKIEVQVKDRVDFHLTKAGKLTLVNDHTHIEDPPPHTWPVCFSYALHALDLQAQTS